MSRVLLQADKAMGKMGKMALLADKATGTDALMADKAMCKVVL